MEQSLARKFEFGSLLRFAFPTIVMMVFMSLYTMVDGVFVSRLVGTDALSAVNIVFPAISVVIAAGVMLATGGSAVIATKLGQKRDAEARQDFTLILLAGLTVGLLLSAAGLAFLRPMLRMLGADDALFALCRDYTYPLLFFVPGCMLQMLFQTLFVTAGKPMLGLGVTALGGIANIVLDYVFIGPLHMGIAGAAVATGIGYCIPALFGAVYFSCARHGSLYVVKPRWDGRMLLRCCANGSSEMVTNLANAVTTFLFNILMLRYAGERGVASITIVLYTQYLLTAVYLGYATGTAPVFSYKYGMQDEGQLKKLFRISLLFIGVCAAATFAASLLFAGPIVAIFTDPADPVYAMTVYGFHRFAVSFLFTGFSIFASALFTAFSDGRVSAIISFLRTFVFIVAALLLLPRLWGLEGVWLALPAAEVLGVLVAAFYLIRKRKTYAYA